MKSKKDLSHPQPGDDLFSRLFAGKCEIHVYRGENIINGYPLFLENATYPGIIDHIQKLGLKIMWQKEVFVRSINHFKLG